MIYKNKKILLLLLSVIALIAILLVILNPKTQNDLTDKNSVPVYFVKTYGEDDYKLLAVRRKIYKQENRLKVALAGLLNGPLENEKRLGYFSEIPMDTKLIEITETPERIIINFSQEFNAGGGSESMIFRLEQLINTVLDSVGQKPVYLEIDSEQVKYIGGEGLIVPQPLSRNLSKCQDI